MNILVTGGAGFIGSHLVERLIPEHKVTVLDDFNTYYSPRIKTDNLVASMDDIVLVNGDIRNRKVTRTLFQDGEFDLVLHLAARAGVRPSIEDPFLYSDVNCNGTINLLELCREFGVKRFFLASSSSVYGNNKKIPFHEDDAVENPISPYAATKRAAELFCANYHELYDMEVACLRFFTVYGPRQRPDMAIHKFTRAIEEGQSIKMFGDGSSARNYTYVSDIVDGLVGLIDKHKGFAIYNLAGDGSITLKDLIALIAEKLGKEAIVQEEAMQAGDVDRTVADFSRLKELTGYNPQYPIEKGIEEFVKWYRRDV
jgi:UDP-glucuronate 4-epimerase